MGPSLCTSVKEIKTRINHGNVDKKVRPQALRSGLRAGRLIFGKNVEEFGKIS